MKPKALSIEKTIKKNNLVKYSTFFLLLIVNFSALFAQSKESAFKDAIITAQTTLKKDFKTVLEYTHPNILKVTGGADVMLPQIEAMFTRMEEDGFKFAKAEVLSVSEIV